MKIKSCFFACFTRLFVVFAMGWALLLPSCQRSERRVKIVQAPAPVQSRGAAAADQNVAPAPPASRDRQAGAPEYVWQVLQHVRRTGQAPEGYVGGRTFQNREQRLPRYDAPGNRIQYREWDVHPKIRGQHRGAERLVTGSDGSAWYTRDHYRTFVKIE